MAISLQSRLIFVVSIAWLLIISFGLALSYRYEGQSIWLDWEQRPGGWCEHDRATEFVRERSNSWSDVSYLFLGLWMISQGVFDQLAMKKKMTFEELIKCNTLVAVPLLSVIIGFYNVVHAFGTFWYHACACFHGHNLDVAGMLTVTSFPFLYVLFSKWSQGKENNDPTTGGLIYGFFLTVLFLIYYILSLLHLLPNFEMEMLMALVITTDLVCVYWFIQRKTSVLQFKYLYATLVCFGVGFIFQRLDKGHAVWHVFTCVAIYCVFMFFRTARPPTNHIKTN